MTTENSACLGCYLQPGFVRQPLGPATKLVENSPLSEDDKTVLWYLGRAVMNMNQCKLSESDKQDFLKAIHDAQKIIALQVAKKANPEIWLT